MGVAPLPLLERMGVHPLFYLCQTLGLIRVSQCGAGVSLHLGGKRTNDTGVGIDRKTKPCDQGGQWCAGKGLHTRTSAGIIRVGVRIQIRVVRSEGSVVCRQGISHTNKCRDH